MWVSSKFGFYSIVKKPDGWNVRARVKKDLENVLAASGLENPIKVYPEADYRFRIIVDAAGLAAVFEVLEKSIDYDNFKSMIGRTPDQQEKLHAYHNVWNEMFNIQWDTDTKKMFSSIGLESSVMT